MNSTKQTFLRVILAPTLLLAAACSKSNDTNTAALPLPTGRAVQTGTTTKASIPADVLLIRSNYSAGEVTSLCEAAIAETKARLDQIAQVPADQRTETNTVLAFETVTADFGDKTNQLAFMGEVHTNKDINAEGSDCEQKAGAFMVDVFTRRDLYNALKDVATSTEDVTNLKDGQVKAFEKNGLKLDDTQLAVLKGLLNQISEKTAKFGSNLNTDTSSVQLTEDGIKGLPKDFVTRLKRSADGKYIVTTSEADYSTFMQNASNADARHDMMLAYLNRGGIENTQLLEETTKLRAQVAKMLGYATWADYQLDGRMAESKVKVFDFLNSLKDKLAQRNRSDLDQLLVYKKSVDPTATTLNQWDISWAQNQLLKRDYQVDDEAIRDYFPADVVISGMFSVYSQILGVHFNQVTDGDVWSPDVQLYEIRNTADNRLIGYFYTDFVPRPLKYGHAAAFQEVSGREINGKYNYPVSAIVANLTPPTPGKSTVSLLSHDDVETIFHEFGHIMHQTLTRAKYASASGSNVAQDFVEAPSQMLENWVWSPEVLPLLSGYYLDHSKKLPDDMLTKMLAARNFGSGIRYTKQLLYALFDMTIHSGDGDGDGDVTSTYDGLYKQIVGEDPIQGGHFAGTFGHLMGGYDAGYYGYLWSEVYAQDMFSIFQADTANGALLSPVIGARYRADILERGSMTEAMTNLKDFLGRDPSPDAFFKKLGL